MSDAASCNPPRRAKRPKVDSSATTSPLTSPILKPSAPDPTGTDAEDPSFDGLSTPATTSRKRGGRKAGNMTRAAREALRKANHSLIEKARRTKINEALATLRRIVPADYQRGDLGVIDDGRVKVEGSSKKDEKEKEFKLEILERTVVYLQELKDRVRVLEDKELGGGRCQDCSGGLKRKRNGSNAMEDAVTRNAGPLPSIASWLPHSYLGDPNSVPDTPSMSCASSSSSSQILYTPANIGQRHIVPPPLTLPSPNLRPSDSRPTPITLEDESAATMLLHIATSPSLSPSFSDGSVISSPELEKASSPRRSTKPTPQTPASLLGLNSHMQGSAL